MKRSLKAIALMMTLLMIVTACGKAETTEGTTTKVESDSKASTELKGEDKEEAENTDEVIELRISWWGSEARHNGTLAVIEKFEAENPNIKIKPEYSGYGGYQDKLNAQIISRTAPDIYTCVAEWLPDLKASDGLADLRGLVDVSGQNELLVEACVIDEELLGINLSVGVRGVMTNATLLESLGLQPFPNGYKWSELSDELTAVHTASNGEIYGMADVSVDEMAWNVFTSSYGFSKLEKEEPFPAGTESYNITKEDLLDWWAFWGALRETGAVAPPELSSVNDDGANSIFIKGLVAYEINNTGSLSKFAEQMEGNIEFIHTPRSSEGKSGELARPPLVFSVFKHSEHQEAAVKFLNYFTNSTDVVADLGTTRGLLPTVAQRNALAELDGVLSESDLKITKMVNEELTMELNRMPMEPNGAGELKGIFQTLGQEVAFGVKTPEDAADDFLSATAKLFE